MFKVTYNEGQGFTEREKEYKSLKDAIEKEGNKIIDAKIYKNGKRIF